MKVLFPNPTPERRFAVGEVALSQDDPLSVDLTMCPEEPTATNIPEPEEDEEEEELSELLVELSELLVELSEESSEVLVELSEESSEDEVVLSVLVVVVLLSSDFAQEETITAMLTIKTNQDKKLFIFITYIENVVKLRLHI